MKPKENIKAITNIGKKKRTKTPRTVKQLKKLNIKEK